MSRKTKMLKIKYSDEDFVMGCPVCGFEYNHAGEITKQDGKDNYQTEFGDVFRGDALIINMECEEGHCYRVVFGNHKGYLYLFAVLDKVEP